MWRDFNPTFSVSQCRFKLLAPKILMIDIPKYSKSRQRRNRAALVQRVKNQKCRVESELLAHAGHGRRIRIPKHGSNRRGRFEC